MKLLFMAVLLGIFFVSSVQPMLMISALILIVFLYSYIMYNIMGGYWFSYALVLVMLSGVLVVFTYMVSLIPNESFDNLNLGYVLMLMLTMGTFYYVGLYNVKMGYISLMLWNSFFGYFNMFMVSFLLMIMLLVVWLSYIGYGALRI